MNEPIVRISYNCGCSFRTNRYSEAVEHVRQTRHDIDVSGKIQIEKMQKPRMSSKE